ncbi:replication initiation and membrane attachment family protein [Lacticaseibacillus sp. GG6-2]
MDRPQSFMAQDDYLVTQATYFSDRDQQVAISLYQPLVGPVALALYLSLWQEVHKTPALTDRQPQTRLLDLLNIDVDTLFQARIRLEAVGLLKTYTTTDSISRYYAYELYAPVTPQAFFSDDLLGMLLYDRVGETRYSQLASQFTLYPVRREEWQDISHDFLSVFQLTNVLEQPPVTTQAKRALAQKPAPKVSLGDAAGYDWVLLAQMLTRSNLAAGELDRNRESLYQIARLYGLQPPELSRLIMKATDVMTGKLNLKQVREFAEQSYQKTAHPAFVEQGQDVQTPANKPKSQLKLTVEEAELLARATNMAPAPFLDDTKKRKANDSRAKAWPNETFALRKLMDDHTFDTVTINILVDYIFRSYDSLSQALLGSFVTRWVNAGVKTPDAALAQIRKETAEKAKPKANRNRPTRQEEIPTWLKPENATKATKPVAHQDQQSIRNKLDALRKLQHKGADSQ